MIADQTAIFLSGYDVIYQLLPKGQGEQAR